MERMRVSSRLSTAARAAWGRALRVRALPVIAGVGGTLGAIAVYAAYVHAGDEEVVTPHEEAEEADQHGGEHHEQPGGAPVDGAHAGAAAAVRAG